MVEKQLCHRQVALLRRTTQRNPTRLIDIVAPDDAPAFLDVDAEIEEQLQHVEASVLDSRGQETVPMRRMASVPPRASHGSGRLSQSDRGRRGQRGAALHRMSASATRCSREYSSGLPSGSRNRGARRIEARRAGASASQDDRGVPRSHEPADNAHLVSRRPSAWGRGASRLCSSPRPRTRSVRRHGAKADRSALRDDRAGAPPASDRACRSA